MNINWQAHFAVRTKQITGSQIRQFFALTERPEVISFAGGFPSSDFFPREEIARTLSEIVREEASCALQYAPTEGHYELRAYLAAKMRREGIAGDAGNIIILEGSQQGLDLLCRILVDPGDPVLVEEPAYVGGMGAIKSYGGIPVGIAMDEKGPLPEIMEAVLNKLNQQGKKARLFYTVSNFQNPTGYTTSLNRRKIILELAERYDFIILEDNPYGELSYEGKVPPSYKSLDNSGRVVYLGSYSKTFIPGIRTGWAVCDLPLLKKISLAKQTADLCSNSLGQRLAYRLSVEGYIDRHVQRLNRLYRQKRDRMLSAISEFFPPEISFTRPGGGFFVWVLFPSDYPPAPELLNLALERQVAFVDGTGFYSNGGGTQAARFSFSQPGIDDISEGIRRLGELFYSLRLKSAPHKSGSSL